MLVVSSSLLNGGGGVKIQKSMKKMKFDGKLMEFTKNENTPDKS
jgi:hypothetical protein